MPETPVDTRFAFQPSVNLHTGGVVAMEMLARPVHRDVRSLLRLAAHTGGLERLHVTLAVAAARYSSEHETLLPLHINLMADTIVTEEETLAPLHHVLSGTGRQANQTVLEINPSHAALKPTCSSRGCTGYVASGTAMHINQAAAVHPPTGLPGSDMVADLLDRKVADGDAFAVTSLDVDDFDTVNHRGRLRRDL